MTMIKKRRSYKQALMRHFRALKAENSGLNILHFVWPVVGMIAFSFIVWVIGSKFAVREFQPQIDFAKLFPGAVVKELDNELVEATYVCTPKPDGFVRFPQLQDWDYKEGVYKEEWLLGAASLRAAYEQQVSIECDFQLIAGTNIMPAVGVRNKGQTRISVMLERSGRITVLKYIDDKPTYMISKYTGAGFNLGETHRLKVDAVTIEPQEPSEPEPLGGPPEAQVQMENPANHPPITDEEPVPEIKGPIPETHLTIYLDDRQIFNTIVPKYKIAGWITFDSWNSKTLIKNVRITGKPNRLWVINSVITNNAIQKHPVSKK